MGGCLSRGKKKDVVEGEDEVVLERRGQGIGGQGRTSVLDRINQIESPDQKGNSEQEKWTNQPKAKVSVSLRKKLETNTVPQNKEFRSRNSVVSQSIRDRQDILKTKVQEGNEKETKKITRQNTVLWEENSGQDSDSPVSENNNPATSQKVYRISVIPIVKPSNPNFDHHNEVPEFAKFAEATDMITVLEQFSELLAKLGVDSKNMTYSTMLPVLREKLWDRIPTKYDKLLHNLEVKAACREYMDKDKANSVAAGKHMVVLGAGPCGLRLALELQLLGAKTTVVEKRTHMTRNNVLKLHEGFMVDLKMLGAKQLFQKLGHGGINHVSIWMLQIVLLKICLLLGVEVRAGETFMSLQEPLGDRGWLVVTEKEQARVEAECDMVLCATGSKVPLEGFARRQPETKMSIAITANWRVSGSKEEKLVKEIPGISWQNDQDFFNMMDTQHNINLENLVHFKDLTNYFVMTAKKDSLLARGVILKDRDREGLLHKDNIDRAALAQYAMDAARFSTEHFSSPLPCTLDDLEDDVSIFDFSHLDSSSHAGRVVERGGRRVVLGLVGDSLMQPFWPEGLGIRRGFLSVWDTAWMVRRLCLQPEKVVDILQEREEKYALQRTADNDLRGKDENYRGWTIDPSTRYQATATATNIKRENILKHFDTDKKVP